MAMLNTGLLASVASLVRPYQRAPSMPYRLAATVSSRSSGDGPPPCSGNIPNVSSSTPLRTEFNSGVSVRMLMPAVAGVEHDAGNPRTPSTCTRHVRQAPIGFMSGSLQSWGTYVPEALIASNTDAPSAVENSLPLIEIVMLMSR